MIFYSFRDGQHEYVPFFLTDDQGIARTQSPTNKNCALKWSTFETIVGVNQPEVQWDSLTLEEPPSWSWLTSAPGKYAG